MRKEVNGNSGALPAFLPSDRLGAGVPPRAWENALSPNQGGAMHWLDQYSHTRPQDGARLAGTGIHGADDFLSRLTCHADLRQVSRESGIPEQRLLTLAVQAQFHRLRPLPMARAS